MLKVEEARVMITSDPVENCSDLTFAIRAVRENLTRELGEQAIADALIWQCGKMAFDPEEDMLKRNASDDADELIKYIKEKLDEKYSHRPE